MKINIRKLSKELILKGVGEASSVCMRPESRLMYDTQQWLECVGSFMGFMRRMWRRLERCFE